MILLLIGLSALLCILVAKRKVCEYWNDKFYDPEFEAITAVIEREKAAGRAPRKAKEWD